jgi:ABC-type multidrug transport system ATPase subunit
MSAIEVRNLRKRFPGREVLTGLDLSIEAGSIFGLLGRNGAGKTSLIRLLLGAILPDGGSVAVLGADLRLSREKKQSVGHVADSDVYPGWCKLGHVVSLERSLRTAWDDGRIREWLAAEHLAAGVRLKHLSEGQRKRFEIEIALAADPAVLLLDEPLAHLDPVAKSDVLGAVLDRVTKRGTCVLISSHVLSDLERVCDRIGVLNGGRLALDVTLDELKESRGASLDHIGTDLLRELGSK